MEDFKKVENLVEHVKEYMHVRVDEARLGLAERTSGVIAFLIAGAAVTGIFTLCFIFICFAAAILLGKVLDDLVLGYLLVATFLLLAGILIWATRGRLIRIPVMNAILRQLSLNDSGDEED